MNETAIYPSLENKTVIVTGGASGIGASIVENFLQQGSKVAFLDKEENLGKKLVEKFNYFKHQPVFSHCDLTNINNLKDSIEYIKSQNGPVSILVNNAANDERHSIDSVTEDFWDDIFRTEEEKKIQGIPPLITDIPYKPYNPEEADNHALMVNKRLNIKTDGKAPELYLRLKNSWGPHVGIDGHHIIKLSALYPYIKGLSILHMPRGEYIDYTEGAHIHYTEGEYIDYTEDFYPERININELKPLSLSNCTISS